MAINYDKSQKRHVELYSQTHIAQYREGIDVLLNMLGSPEALVTDASRLSDWENGGDVLEAPELHDAFDSDSLLWKVAQGVMYDDV